MVVTAVTEEEDSEVEGGEVSEEMVVVVTGSGTAAAAVGVAAMATTEEDTNATSVKLLITEVPTCGLIGLTVTRLGWQRFLLAVSEGDRCISIIRAEL